MFKWEKGKYRDTTIIVLMLINNNCIFFENLTFSVFPTINKKIINGSVFNAVDYFFPLCKWQFSEKKLAAINRDNDEAHPRNNQARDTSAPRNQ